MNKPIEKICMWTNISINICKFFTKVKQYHELTLIFYEDSKQIHRNAYLDRGRTNRLVGHNLPLSILPFCIDKIEDRNIIKAGVIGDYKGMGKEFESD